MIEIQNLSKSYGRIDAVKNLNFTIEKGEVLGFLGPNGAGKSTTMNMITGCLSSTSGTVSICGYDIMEDPIEAKKHIGYLPEIPPVYMDMTVIEYLNFVADLKKVKGVSRKIQLQEIMELVKIYDVRNRLIKNLSKGYRQRVGIAQSIVGRPEVLILDEPTVGLDPKQIIEIRKLIKDLGKEHTIILSSHILPEVNAVCDRVVIINKGQIVAIDTPEALLNKIDNSNNYIIRIEGPKSNVHGILKGFNGIVHADVSREKGNDDFEYRFEAEKGIDVRRGLFFELAKNGYPILELKADSLTLEDVFLHLTTQEAKANELEVSEE